MSTIEPRLVVPPHVDLILHEIGRTLQITPTQYERARRAYHAVGDWLDDSASPLALHRPEIYPQGSMALRTTVRPMHEEEFDLDLVCELAGWTGTAMALYNAIGSRLKDNGTYRQMLEGKNRCWRLNYGGDFHLDVLPGRDGHNHFRFAIEVPDRSAQGWKPSNPRGYLAWFDARVRPYYALFEDRKTPLPTFDPGDAGDPLRRSIQLMKRHRDVRFDGNPENAPRSIVLTTLAAKHYHGQESVGEALLGALAGIRADIANVDGILRVPNPTNPEENFADAWLGNRKAYDEFVVYVDQFATELRALFAAPFNEQFRRKSERLFGADIARKAIDTYNDVHGVHTTAALMAIGASAGATGRPWCRD